MTSANTARENMTSLWYTDCYPNADCLFVYRNGSSATYRDGVFSGRAPAPAKQTTTGSLIVPPGADKETTTTAPVTPVESNYVNKTGPKRQTYDKEQGGIKKYKQEDQSDVAGAAKSGPTEPLCKGRNQMIIMADKRISASIYLTRLRNLEFVVAESDEPKTLKLEVAALPFQGASLIKATLISSLGLAMAVLAALF
jgi:hypothetical protein